MLLGAGSWMMVTNIMAPLLMNVDRLLIGHVSGPGALASYAPAMDLAGKAFLLPGVCLALLFPALGHHLAHAPEKAVAVYDASLRTLAWWMTPFLVLAVVVALLWIVIEKKEWRTPRTLVLLVPLLLLSAWGLLTRSMYNESHLAATFQSSVVFPSMTQAYFLLVFLAGAAPVLAAPLFFSGRKWPLVVALLAAAKVAGEGCAVIVNTKGITADRTPVIVSLAEFERLTAAAAGGPGEQA
jgi:hypothetical protein